MTMKKALISILVLMLLCMSLTALAEGDEAVTLEVKTENLPVYAADDAYAAGFRAGAEQAEANTLPVLLVPVNKSVQLQTRVKPAAVKNKKTVFSAADPELIQVRGNTVTGLKTGETVLTIASEQDPSVTVQYLAVVYNQVTKITLAAESKYVAVGQTVPVTAALAPENATVKDLVWTSSDEKIATVDGNGNVTGVKRGNVRISAAAKDGSKAHGDFFMAVQQNAEEITLDKQEVTVDTGRTAQLTPTVLPKNTNDKSVVWSSSDESVAKVNYLGRVTGVGRGDCEITCTSKTTGSVWAKATVHVQQPVTKISFEAAPVIYVNESGTLKWNVEPADASNPAVKLTSGNEKVLKVSEDGTITGTGMGTTLVSAVATDGSNRRAQVRVRVMRHVERVDMKRKVAYIDYGESAIASAVIKPESFTNHNMTWTSEDETIAKASSVKDYGDHVRIKGMSVGETKITGKTEDGGFETSIQVKVGDWSHAAKIAKAKIDKKGNICLQVRNMSKNVRLTYIKVKIEAFDNKGKPVAINKKDGTNVVYAIYKKSLSAGKTTPEDKWEFEDLDSGKSIKRMTVRVLEYQINGDWVKKLRTSLQPVLEYKAKK